MAQITFETAVKRIFNPHRWRPFSLSSEVKVVAIERLCQGVEAEIVLRTISNNLTFGNYALFRALEGLKSQKVAESPEETDEDSVVETETGLVLV